MAKIKPEISRLKIAPSKTVMEYTKRANLAIFNITYSNSCDSVLSIDRSFDRIVWKLDLIISNSFQFSDNI